MKVSRRPKEIGEILFEDRIIDLITRKGFNSPEFQMMIRVFGRKKLTEICMSMSYDEPTSEAQDGMWWKY